MAGNHRKRKRKYWGIRGTHKALGVVFESGFEKKFLDQCYMQGIKVQRCEEKVPYLDSSGKLHHYVPDFYLPDFDYVVEIKGSWAFQDNHGHVKEKFFAAQRFFKGRYTLITEKELKGDFVARLHKELMSGN